MDISKEEIIHIANLANLNLKDEEIDKYILNLQDILNFANIINNAPINGLEESIGASQLTNVFREDKVEEFEDTKSLLRNAPAIKNNMFEIPKVIE